MKHKRSFVTPTVTRRVPLMLEDPILGPSIEYNTKVISMGQAVETHDFANDATLEAYWE